MAADKIRRRIAWEAARLMYNREETEYIRAKRKAARLLGHGHLRTTSLPSNREIREQLNALARQFEGSARLEQLADMRREALAMMKLLSAFRPKLIGSVLTGHIRRDSDIDLHLFSDSVEQVAARLDTEGIPYSIERKRVVKNGVEQTFTHIHVNGRFRFEMTVYPTEKVNYPFRCSITGKRMEHADLAALEAIIAREHPDEDAAESSYFSECRSDRFQVYESLLLPLENVRENPEHHPEGDALFHSLQVFELAREELPYDEEFLSAALLHDVGKAIDPGDHVRAGLEALEGYISDRTAWLIEHHMEAQAILNNTAGARLRRRLGEHPDYDVLLLLAECDKRGRQWGVRVGDLDAALDYLRQLDEDFGDSW
ncbi:MAG: HD domain-containing protein [Planctomycetota bacterium]|nr:MAG: HD domain-containing protein [Planctomycetota bacterium]